jgi:tellurite resistance protein TehA-like permease
LEIPQLLRNYAADSIPPGSGAVVMGTGIVSVALLLDGLRTLSRVLLVLAAGAWLVLLAVAAWRLVGARDRFLAEARTPAGLTGVAASAVLGTRLLELGWTGATVGLLVLAAICWVSFSVAVLRRLPVRATGQWFMLTVAAESIAALAAGVASREGAGWLAVVGLVLALAGVACYPLVVVRFDRGELLCARGDHWIGGGSLAISTLAFAQLAVSARDLDALGGLAGALKVAAFVVWVAAIAWLPVLLIAEVRRPRLHYNVRRWSTVFPLGMYAACSFVVDKAAMTPALSDFARVWVWVAVACWAVVAVGLGQRAIGVRV